MDDPYVLISVNLKAMLYTLTSLTDGREVMKGKMNQSDWEHYKKRTDILLNLHKKISEALGDIARV